jgi:hypothetical protein
MRTRYFLLPAAALLSGAGTGRAQVPGFRHEVMPVLSRMGCNAGACHGSAGGKGNLKLSLRGEDPWGDFLVLTKNRDSKRLNIHDPESSSLLRKPAGLSEHEGGTRFTPDSEEFRLLREWIAAGAPADEPDTPDLMRLTVSPAEWTQEGIAAEVPLQVTAHFSDTTQRDVTRWAVFEPSNLLVQVSREGRVRAQRTGESTVIVRFEHLQTPVPVTFLPQRPGYAWPDTPEHNIIDTHLFAKLRKLRILPSALCDDVTFLRRACFDLTGLPPSAEEAQAFLRDSAPDKRARLVDALLERPQFATWMALKWADLLRVDERILDETGTAAFHTWLRESMAADKPLDQFVRELVSALGSTYQNPPANYYRALRDPVTRSESTAQLFLGTRLGCAKCHNHPFERWTQDDYYRFAAAFDGISYKIVENKRKDENDKMEFVGEQTVELVAKRELKDPRSGKAPEPGFLGSPQTPQGGEQRLEALAAWMTSPQHPLFAKVLANRLWAHFMGRGLVDPVDDFRLTNPPSNPAILEALTAQLVSGGFRQKNVMRLICNSRAYQLSAEPNDTNADDETNFSRALVRRLPAESVLDAMHAALGLELNDEKFPGLRRAGEIPGARFITKTRKPSDAERFLKEFGKPPRATSCDCERVNASSLSQVFTLTSGPALHEALKKEGNLISKLMENGQSAEAAVEALYWHTLSRGPSAEERGKLSAWIASQPDFRRSLEDVAWSLVNAKEFLLRR